MVQYGSLKNLMRYTGIKIRSAVLYDPKYSIPIETVRTLSSEGNTTP